MYSPAVIAAETTSSYVGPAIGAGAALLGSLIGGFTAYFLGRQRVDHERKQWTREQRRLAYSEIFPAARGYYVKALNRVMQGRGSSEEVEAAFEELYSAYYRAGLFTPEATREKLGNMMEAGRDLLYITNSESPKASDFGEPRATFLKEVETFRDQAWLELGLHEE
jgi:hypothetical protein